MHEVKLHPALEIATQVLNQPASTEAAGQHAEALLQKLQTLPPVDEIEITRSQITTEAWKATAIRLLTDPDSEIR